MKWLDQEAQVFWCVFIATFLAVAVWETYCPKRELRFPAGKRWGHHALLYLLAGLVSRLVPMSGPMLVAVHVADRPWGLLNHAAIPLPISIISTVLLLDFMRYGAHAAHHKIGALWRLHQVHHSDPDFDVATYARTHPVEGVIIRGLNAAAVYLLAPPVIAVLAFEIVSVVHGFFSHANATMPDWLARGLQKVVFTPEEHRVHHSVDYGDQNTNFGEIFPWWDRLFGTYRGRSIFGPEFDVGLKDEQSTAGDAITLTLMPLRRLS